MINKQLAEDRGISELNQVLIKAFHKEREELFDKSLATKMTQDVQLDIFSDWLGVERSLQLLWGFNEEDRFIKFWKFPTCSCPSMDNEDAYPTGYYYVNGDCIIHSNEVSTNPPTNQPKEKQDESIGQ